MERTLHGVFCAPALGMGWKLDLYLEDLDWLLVVMESLTPSSNQAVVREYEFPLSLQSMKTEYVENNFRL